jgi:hypothetical protein
MSLVNELLEDAIALQKDGLSPGRIGLALSDRWEAEHLEADGKVRRTRSREGTIELLFPGGEKIVWDGASWHYIAASN